MARGETIAHPCQVTPVVVQHSATVDQNQVINPKQSISASSVWARRDRCWCVSAESSFHTRGTNPRKVRDRRRSIDRRLRGRARGENQPLTGRYQYTSFFGRLGRPGGLPLERKLKTQSTMDVWVTTYLIRTFHNLQLPTGLALS